VRQALLGALQHDPSPAVRLKALDGLKQLPETCPFAPRWPMSSRRTTTRMSVCRPSTCSPRITTTRLWVFLQNVLQKEDNPYVHAQIIQLLEQLRASVGRIERGNVD